MLLSDTYQARNADEEEESSSSSSASGISLWCVLGVLLSLCTLAITFAAILYLRQQWGIAPRDTTEGGNARMPGPFGVLEEQGDLPREKEIDTGAFVAIEVARQDANSTDDVGGLEVDFDRDLFVESGSSDAARKLGLIDMDAANAQRGIGGWYNVPASSPGEGTWKNRTMDQNLLQQSSFIAEELKLLSESETFALVQHRLERYATYLDVEGGIAGLEKVIQQHAPPPHVDLHVETQALEDVVQYRFVHIPKCGGSSFCMPLQSGFGRAMTTAGVCVFTSPFGFDARGNTNEDMKTTLIVFRHNYAEAFPHKTKAIKQEPLSNTIAFCGAHHPYSKMVLLQPQERDLRSQLICNATGTLQHVSISTLLRGAVDRYVSYWFYSPGYKETFTSLYCENDAVCPVNFEKNTKFQIAANEMVFLLGTTTTTSPHALISEERLKDAMMTVLKLDVFSFITMNQITPKLFGHVYGNLEQWKLEGHVLVANANPRPGRSAQDFTPQQRDRLSSFVAMDAALVDFAKHVLVWRWREVWTLEEVKQVLSLDEDWLTDSGKTHILR